MTIDSQEEENYVNQTLNPTTEYKLFYSRKQHHSFATHRNTNTHNFIQSTDTPTLPNMVKHIHTVTISSSVLLGITDAVVETVFRTPEGFITPWMNWYSDEPNDASKTQQEDCVVRHVGGLWRDWRCSRQWNFYCEGKCFKEFSNT